MVEHLNFNAFQKNTHPTNGLVIIVLVGYRYLADKCELAGNGLSTRYVNTVETGTAALTLTGVTSAQLKAQYLIIVCVVLCNVFSALFIPR